MIDVATRIRRAIRANDVLLLKRILTTHASYIRNPDTSSIKPLGLSNTNLHLAASLGHVKICELLISLGHELDNGVPTPALNDNFQTALMLASAAGHTDVVHFLAQHDPEFIPRSDVKGRDAIMEASRCGHDTVLQILLTYVPGGPEEAVAHADIDGNTALHFASGNGNLLVLRTLLAAGAEADRENHWRWTASAYSATVQAEVYLKTLVAEQERKKAHNRQLHEAEKGGLRFVGLDGDPAR